MPSSGPDALTFVCRNLITRKPQSVLDIGVCFGKWGFLAREYADIWHLRYPRETWKTRIDGVEIFPDYITDLHRLIYDHIYIGDIVDVLPTLPKYDFIIFADVLEHIEKERGKSLLHAISNRCKYCIVVIPVIVSAQKMVLGNPWEEHVSSWRREELEKYGKVSILNRSYILEVKNG